jgi:chromosome segregation ATPase
MEKTKTLSKSAFYFSNEVLNPNILETYVEYNKIKNEITVMEKEMELLARELDFFMEEVQNKKRKLNIHREDYNRFRTKMNKSSFDDLLDEFAELENKKETQASSASQKLLEAEKAVLQKMMLYKSKGIELQPLPY